MTRLTTLTLLSMLFSSGLATSSEPLGVQNESGETLMFHRLNNGELWGSFIITDQVAASFADHELIVLHVDRNKPIKLDHAKHCGGGKAEFTQQVTYSFEAKTSGNEWQFNQVEKSQSDFLQLVGWDEDMYHHMRSDRRPEVVDFPIQGLLAIDDLWQQFSQGNKLVFRYVTDEGESRQAVFDLRPMRDELLKL